MAPATGGGRVAQITRSGTASFDLPRFGCGRRADIHSPMMSVVAKLNGRQRHPVDLKRKNVGARIVTCHVEGTPRSRSLRRLNLAIEHGLVTIVRPGLDLPERPNNQCSSVT